MQCDICQRQVSRQLPFNCTICARDALYQSRIRSAQTLLHRESLRLHIENVVATSSTVFQENALREESKDLSEEAIQTWTIQSTRNQQDLTDATTQNLHNQRDLIYHEIKSVKLEIANRKELNQQRARALASAQSELSKDQAVCIKPIARSIRHTKQDWGLLHGKTIEARSFLCKEAASLYSLQQRKKRKGGVGRDVTFIGGLPIVDLRDLNNASPSQVTTTTTNLARLIHLVSHYLSLRLPAEIILPLRSHSLPTIFFPSSSYTGRHFPFLSTGRQNNSSPSVSTHGEQRPLYLDKKLSALIKENPTAYASFIEGITLLAWDIAWMCRIQGLAVGEVSSDDICAMGNNLWQLLFGPLPRKPNQRTASNHNPLLRSPFSRDNFFLEQGTSIDDFTASPRLGHFSHGTVSGYIISGPATEYMSNWKYQFPVKVIDNVKAMLLTEGTGAEWEILEGNEWEEEINQASTATKQGETSLNRLAIEDTGVLVNPSSLTAAVENTDRHEKKDKGTSGWTKLKNR